MMLPPCPPAPGAGQAITSTATAWISAACARTVHSQPQQRDDGQPQHHGHEHRQTPCPPAAAVAAPGGRRVFRQADDLASTVSEPTACTCITMRPSPLMERPSEPPAQDRRQLPAAPARQHGFIHRVCHHRHHAIGDASPGRTTSRSPSITLATGTSTRRFPDSRCTTSGRRACSARDGQGLAFGPRFQTTCPAAPAHDHGRPSSRGAALRPGWIGRRRQPTPRQPQPALVPMATSRSMLPVSALRIQPAL